MQVGDGDRVKKKKRKKESTVDEGGKERQRGREAVELNRIGPTAWCGVFAGSSSKDICSAYVCTYIYIYIYTGPLETLPRLGVTRTKDEDIKHRIGTRHVVHASIKSTWKVTLVPRDTNLDMGATRPWRSSATHPRLANCLKSDRAEAVGLIKR